jgi:hypothetical protein
MYPQNLELVSRPRRDEKREVWGCKVYPKIYREIEDQRN